MSNFDSSFWLCSSHFGPKSHKTIMFSWPFRQFRLFWLKGFVLTLWEKEEAVGWGQTQRRESPKSFVCVLLPFWQKEVARLFWQLDSFTFLLHLMATTHYQSLRFLVAPCCSQGATLHLTLPCGLSIWLSICLSVAGFNWLPPTPCQLNTAELKRLHQTRLTSWLELHFFSSSGSWNPIFYILFPDSILWWQSDGLQMNMNLNGN